jgi:hypothetical protein
MVGFPTCVNPLFADVHDIAGCEIQSDFRAFRSNYCHKKYAVFLTKNLRFNTSCKGVSHRHASVGGSASGKWSTGGETAGTEPERNELAVPPTEARRECDSPFFATRRARVERSATGVGRGILRLRFYSVVLLIFLRPDASLDSPTSLESA